MSPRSAARQGNQALHDAADGQEYEGTGLGLPLTEGLMRLHGGTLEITSQINIGTTAVAKFPPERMAISGRAIAG